MSIAVSRPSDLLTIGSLRSRRSEREAYPCADKAISQRATILASLASGQSCITGLADCADMRSNIAALQRLGVIVEQREQDQLVVVGRFGRESRAGLTQLDCGNSATTARLLTAVLSSQLGEYRVSGNASLSSRPMWWLVDGLRSLGAGIQYLECDGTLPLAIRGCMLQGGAYRVPVDSAQAVSALAFAALGAREPVVVARRTRARDHTERLLRWTGIAVRETPSEVAIEPGRPEGFDLHVPRDPSAAAVLAGLHLASPCADQWLHMPGVCLNDRRLGFFRILARMGCDVHLEPSAQVGPESVGCLSVRRGGQWHGVTIEGPELVQSAIDELPIVAALASQADAPTTIRDAAELRDKDTDRIGATVHLLREFGLEAAAEPDGLSVAPATVLRPATPVVIPRDHRIAFAAFVLAVLAGGHIQLNGAAVTATSNPNALAELADFVEIT